MTAKFAANFGAERRYEALEGFLAPGDLRQEIVLGKHLLEREPRYPHIGFVNCPSAGRMRTCALLRTETINLFVERLNVSTKDVCIHSMYS